jgi:hypothetical protein
LVAVGAEAGEFGEVEFAAFGELADPDRATPRVELDAAGVSSSRLPAEPGVPGLDELPDSVTAAAIVFAVSASGLASTRITVLLSPEEIDQVATRSVAHAPPGS